MSLKELEEELEKLVEEVEEMRKGREERKGKELPRAEEVSRVEITANGKLSEIEMPRPKPVKEKPAALPGIPDESHPEIDKALYYLRTQEMLGQPKHDLVVEEIEKLKQYLPEETIRWIEAQFEKPLEERKPIPLCRETDGFLSELRDELKEMILEKFPDAPENEVEDHVQDAIFKAVMKSGGIHNRGRIEKSAKGIIGNMLRMAGF